MDKFLTEKLLFLVMIMLIPFLGVSQDIASIISMGDTYAERKDHLNAIKYYKGALDMDPNHRAAQYKIAESYRALLDYSMAEEYYQKVKRSGDGRFLLSGYYFALMKKLSGDYHEALEETENFMALLKERNQHEDPQYRQYYEQARIEREGCLIALNAITVARPEHQFGLLPEPVNSRTMDSAPATFKNDSIITLSSGRKGGKGAGIGAFGEAWNDIYMFEKKSSGWVEVKDNGKLDIVNSKTEDAAGFFNYTRTKFYFTRCEVATETSIDCFIYVSNLIGGTWSEPTKLNSYINQSGSNSRQATASFSGDSLFFCSDRPGGFGQYDIYLSIKNGDENWGPAQNLGSQINTPFTESSPFYEYKEGNLIFSSDGHRGFGGFDIYLATGETFEKAEIYNMQYPFNSNKDDLFFFLGDHIGYLSSNRDGGIGKLDIYSFRIKSDKEIITEISSEDAIAGRNSLFSDDYDFDSDNDEKISEIISHLMAANVTDVEMVLTNDQLAFYSSLSKDDQERIDRIVSARVRNLSQNDLQAIRVEDEFYYAHLESGDKRHVDNLVSAYVRENGLGLSVSVKQQEQDFYEGLTVADREKVDMIIAQRLKQADDYLYPSTGYNSLNQQEKQSVDQLSYRLIEEKKNLESLALSFNENLFLRSNEERKPLIHKSIKEKVINLTEDPKYQLKEEDRIFYQNLDSKQLNALENIASALILNDVNGFENSISKEDRMVYASFSAGQQKQLDRILIKIINNTVKADLYLGEANFTKNEVAVAKLNPEVDFAFNQLRNTNPGYFSTLSTGDFIKVKRFISVAEPWINSPSSIYLPNEPVTDPGTSIDRGPSIASIKSSRNDGVNGQSNVANQYGTQTIENREISFYEALSPEKRGAINRSIASSLLTEAYSQSPALSVSDLEAFEDLTTKEKNFIRSLALSLNGQTLTPADRVTHAVASSYFNQLAPEEKKTWGRLITKEALQAYRNGNNYGTSSADAGQVLALTTYEKSNLEKLKDYARQTSMIIETELTRISDQSKNTLLNLPPNMVAQNSQISISGKLLNVDNQTPVTSSQLRLVTSNGIPIQTATSSGNGSFSFNNVPNSEYFIESAGGSNGESDRQYIDDLVVRGSGTATSGPVTTEDKVYYENLSVDKKTAFDRAIATELINKSYEGNPALVISDEQFYNTLSRKEKEFISILARDLRGVKFPLDEISVRTTAFSYYQHLIPVEQPVWSRLITAEALSALREGSLYQLSDEDKEIIAGLSYAERNTFERIRLAKMNNVPLLGDIVYNKNLLALLPDHTYPEGTKLTVEGKVNETKTEIPGSNITIRMLDSNNNPISTTSTDNQGRFKFDGINPGKHSINTGDGVGNASSLYIGDLTISDQDGTQIIVPGVGESAMILDQGDINFYEGLNIQNRKSIDRSIAADLINESYQKSPDLIVTDAEFYASLGQKEKDVIQLLARELRGEVTGAREKTEVQSALSYYRHIPQQEQATWTRLITKEALGGNKSGNVYSLNAQDSRLINGLSPLEKNIYSRIKVARISNGVITDGSFVINTNRSILYQLPVESLVPNSNIQVSGRINEVNSNRPVTSIPLKMVDKEGNVISRTATNENGRFTFDRVISDQYAIQLDDKGTASNQSPNYYVDEVLVSHQDPSSQLAANTLENTMKMSSVDIDRYQALERSEKRRIDRLIALEYINAAYKENPSLEASDKREYDSFTSQEKSYVKILVKELAGEELSLAEQQLLSSAFSYYYNVAPLQKAVINRIVSQQVFGANKQGSTYRLSSSDANYRLRMSEDMKGMVERLKAFRYNNERILSENLAVEAIDLGDRKVMLNIPNYTNESFSRLTITGKLINTKTGNPIAVKALRVVDETGTMIAKTFTGNDGAFHFNQIRAGNYHLELEHAYTARTENENYFVKDLEVTGTQGMTHAHQKSFNIYFESGGHQLRSEAREALKDVAELSRHQRILIELKSHTDNIGNPEFNEKLSAMRGESAIDYLVKMGVIPNTISVLAYGQSDPVAPNTDEYGRQFNRRVEVVFKSHDPIHYHPPTIYLIRPKATLYSIAKNFNQSVDEVMDLNGLDQPSIKAYKPIRINNPNGLKPNLDMLVELNESVTTNNSFKYTVKAGESIISIAEKFNLPEELLMEMNGLKTHEVRNGQVLNIYVRY